MKFFSAQLARLAGWRRAVAEIRAAYIAAHQRPPRLWRPRRYTEKMQWRKLFDLNPDLTTLSDKLAVRGFIAARAGETYLVPRLWTGMPEEIPFDRLAPPYVLKSTHASGQVIMIGAGAKIDPAQLRSQATAWLASCHGTQANEPGYTNVPRRLIIEKTLLTPSGTPPNEIRLFVFDGKVQIVNTVIVEAGKLRNGAFHTPDWTRLDWYFSRWLDTAFPPPQRLGDMIRAAEQIGAGFDHVRVDFYDCGASIYAGEVTLYSWSGHARFNPDQADFILGKYWKLRQPLRRALQAMLLKRRA